MAQPTMRRGADRTIPPLAGGVDDLERKVGSADDAEVLVAVQVQPVGMAIPPPIAVAAPTAATAPAPISQRRSKAGERSAPRCACVMARTAGDGRGGRSARRRGRGRGCRWWSRPVDRIDTPVAHGRRVGPVAVGQHGLGPGRTVLAARIDDHLGHEADRELLGHDDGAVVGLGLDVRAPALVMASSVMPPAAEDTSR